MMYSLCYDVDCMMWLLRWQVAEIDIRRCEGPDIQVGKERLNSISDW